MPKRETDDFYKNISVYEGHLTELLSDEKLFKKVPEDWHVVITDIRESTLAVQQGRNQEVNLVATASIISALNIAKSRKINFPFFFGGDGATLLLPDSMKEEVMEALSEHQENVKNTSDLDLRVDEIPVSEIYEDQKKLTIAKSKLSEKYTIPVILGEGLLYADKRIKERRFELKGHDDEALLNLEGMECRWDAVKPPENTKEIVCILVKATESENQAKVYKSVLTVIEEIYGTYKERRPISVKGLKLLANISRFKTEHRIKYGADETPNLAKNLLDYAVGKFYLTYQKAGKNYLKSMVELSDTLVMDGRINTVISGVESHRKELNEKLSDMEQKGLLKYGMAVCSESIMSCYVQDRKDNHIHFVDGAEGGYTRAATMLKAKFSD